MMLDKGKDKQPFDRRAKHDLKGQLVLAKAAELFNTKGTRATTLVDIAGRLNLTKTSLYYYVKTKEELVYKCYVQTLDRLSDFVDEAERQSSSKESLLTFARLYMEYWRDVKLGQQPHIALLTEVPILKGAHFRDTMSRISEIRARIAAFITTGIAGGGVHINPELSAQSFISVVQWSMTWLDVFGHERLDFVIEQFEKILCQGLASGGLYPMDMPDLKGGLEEKSSSLKTTSRSKPKLDAFLRIGTRFFNDKGFKGTSIDEISKELGATKGAFYYHIKNKEELLLKCFDRTLEMLVSKQQEADAHGKNGREKLEMAAHG